MTEPRLLLDEMLAPAIAGQLRDRGHDVAAITERPHLTGAADEQVLELAAGETRSVVTLNLVDFAALDSGLEGVQPVARRHRLRRNFDIPAEQGLHRLVGPSAGPRDQRGQASRA